MTGSGKTAAHHCVRNDLYRHAGRENTGPVLEAAGVLDMLGERGAQRRLGERPAGVLLCSNDHQILDDASRGARTWTPKPVQACLGLVALQRRRSRRHALNLCYHKLRCKRVLGSPLQPGSLPR